MHDSFPSPWVLRHAHRWPQGARILDLACGAGRHSRWLAGQGMQVLAVDRDEGALAGLQDVPGVTVMPADLEGVEWPLEGLNFDGILVTRYLFRPRLDDLLNLLKPGGLLIYETFMAGQEVFGKPSRPDFLLQPGELLDLAQSHGLFVVAFEQGEVEGPARVQRLCALRESNGAGVRL